MGVNEQPIPVGKVAGAHARANDSPTMPVPATIEIGMVLEPPAGRVVLEGTVMAGGEAIAICSVTKICGFAINVAVIVTVAGEGGGFGAVKNPPAVIVPALAVHIAGALAVNWNVVPATSSVAVEVIARGPTPVPARLTVCGEPIPV